MTKELTYLQAHFQMVNQGARHRLNNPDLIHMLLEKAVKAVVVVFPCVPATTIEGRLPIKSSPIN